MPYLWTLLYTWLQHLFNLAWKTKWSN